MDGDGHELDYYRSVEDLFASLRGSPHVLSPRDFQLLRSWWREGIPLAAIASGLTEVFASQRERDDGNPVVSLSYCRHAVKRNAKRLAEMRTGESEAGPEEGPSGVSGDTGPLIAALREAAESQRGDRPSVTEVLLRIAAKVETDAGELPAEMLDEHLFGLESEMLLNCWEAIPDHERRSIETHVEKAVAGTSATDEARKRSARALRDREIRLLLEIPRLEIG